MVDKRRQELQRLEDRRDQLDKALRDQDWIERLTNNDDFKAYLKRIGEAQKISQEHKAEIVDYLSSALPLRREREGRIVVLTREELNEQLIVLSATIQSTAEVTGWPEAQEKRLQTARKELPDIEREIKKLKEGGN